MSLTPSLKIHTFVYAERSHSACVERCWQIPRRLSEQPPACILFIPGSAEFGGPGSSVVIATGYGLDGLGSNPGGGEIFHICPDRPWGPPSLLYNVYRVFPGGKEGPESDTESSPLLVPRS